ncbi:MAG: hypothetical protein QNK87_02955 [Octadecabacter sp.]
MTISIASVSSRSCTPQSTRRHWSLMTALTVWSERRALAQMGPSRLKDMGISPIEAANEAARPFWDRSC